MIKVIPTYVKKYQPVLRNLKHYSNPIIWVTSLSGLNVCIVDTGSLISASVYTSNHRSPWSVVVRPRRHINPNPANWQLYPKWKNQHFSLSCARKNQHQRRTGSIIFDANGNLVTLVTHPDGKTITPVYDLVTGKLERLSTAQGDTSYAYHPTSGKLNKIITADSQQLEYTYDGFLPNTSTWTGNINGSISV